MSLSAGRGEGWVLAYTCEGRRLWPVLHIRSLSLWSLLLCVKVYGVGAMGVPASVVSWRAVGSGLMRLWVDVSPHHCVRYAGCGGEGRRRPGSQATLRIVS